MKLHRGLKERRGFCDIKQLQDFKMEELKNKKSTLFFAFTEIAMEIFLNQIYANINIQNFCLSSNPAIDHSTLLKLDSSCIYCHLPIYPSILPFILKSSPLP